AVELNPDNAHAHYLMAFVLGDMGRHQEARAASKRAIQLNPPLARAQTNLSLERYNAERRSQQLRARESPEPQVVEGNELAHYNLGLAFRQKGYYNEALRAYRMALERGEDRRLTLQAMAEVHLLKRDFGAAPRPPGSTWRCCCTSCGASNCRSRPTARSWRPSRAPPRPGTGSASCWWS